MKILLTGIQGTYNYGCEAIIRGTDIILRKFYPDIQIDYISPTRFKDDRKRLKNANVNVINYDVATTIKVFVNKVLRKMKLPYKHNVFPACFLKKYDAVFSIGGDIYTIWSNGGYPMGLIELGDLCKTNNIPYILWGCSVGPFEKNMKIKKIFQKHLSNISLIVAREYVTIDYLKSMGIKENVIFSFDPAFSIPSCHITNKQKNNVIGVNLSPLSLKYLKMNETECVTNHAEMLCGLITEYGYSIILLPHVVDCNEKDNDLYYMKKIYEKIPNELKNNVVLIDNDPGFIGIKEQIKKCDVVIAARMHCAINAIATGVPAIFLSYSEKSKGMSNLIYNTDKYCLPLTSFKREHLKELREFITDIELPNNLFDMITNKENIINSLNLLRNK